MFIDYLNVSLDMFIKRTHSKPTVVMYLDFLILVEVNVDKKDHSVNNVHWYNVLMSK